MKLGKGDLANQFYVEQQKKREKNVQEVFFQKLSSFRPEWGIWEKCSFGVTNVVYHQNLTYGSYCWRQIPWKMSRNWIFPKSWQGLRKNGRPMEIHQMTMKKLNSLINDWDSFPLMNTEIKKCLLFPKLFLQNSR